jgi:glutamyl-tRNA synthetase
MRILEAIGDRLKTFGDILAYGGYFFVTDDKLTYDEKEFAKRLGTPESKELLRRFSEKLSALESFDLKSLEDCLKAFITEAGIKIGDLIHGLRLATTGQPVGPGVYDCLEILGKESVLKRIEIALAR